MYIATYICSTCNLIIDAVILHPRFTFMIGEIIAGVMSNSLAIISDAVHLLSDVAGFAIAPMSYNLSKKVASKQFTFGFARAEVFGAFSSILILYIATGVLVYEAMERAVRCVVVVLRIFGRFVSIFKTFMFGPVGRGVRLRPSMARLCSAWLWSASV